MQTLKGFRRCMRCNRCKGMNGRPLPQHVCNNFRFPVKFFTLSTRFWAYLGYRVGISEFESQGTLDTIDGFRKPSCNELLRCGALSYLACSKRPRSGQSPRTWGTLRLLRQDRHASRCPSEDGDLVSAVHTRLFDSTFGWRYIDPAGNGWIVNAFCWRKVSMPRIVLSTAYGRISMRSFLLWPLLPKRCPRPSGADAAFCGTMFRTAEGGAYARHERVVRRGRRGQIR